MPIYEYQCSNCGHTLEELQSMSEPPLVKCPNCGKDTLQRLIGGGAGLIFKGSGFYLTDYKKSSTQESKTDKPQVKQDTKKDKSEKTSEKPAAEKPDKSSNKKESKKS